MMVGVMVLSFTLLSTAFMLLSYRYILTEKREAMQRNAGYIANFTAANYQLFLNVRNEVYLDYVASVALISDSYVIMANPDGSIIYATDGRNFYEYPDAVIPAEKKKMVAVAAHISESVLVSADTSTSPCVTVMLPRVVVMGRLAMYRRSG